MKLKVNCCDGVYNSFDVHFTKACDNKCAHCIDMKYGGVGGVGRPDADAIANKVIENAHTLDDVLFLGGEPCLYLEELLQCVRKIRKETNLKIFVTTAVPKNCYDRRDLFEELVSEVDGINLSVQHYDEEIADEIRKTISQYDRQAFYASLPHKEKIRINLNVVKPFLFTKEDLTNCLRHYDSMGFNSIKLSEIQHGKDVYVSFADVFGISMKAAYSEGCQTYLDMDKILSGFKTPLLLKRSCFLCEESLPASVSDGIKMIYNLLLPSKNSYGVVYGDGSLKGGWV
jgi:pyruvate-formate lyase-activating enzyme